MSTIAATEALVPDTTAVVLAMPTIPDGQTHTYDLICHNTHATVDCFLNAALGDDEVTPYIIPAVDKNWTRPERIFRMALTAADVALAMYAAAPGSCVVSWKLIRKA